MQTARDYYFQIVAPDENYRSYQYNHHSHDDLPEDLPNEIRDQVTPDEYRKAFLKHVPNRSNDPLLESYLDELIPIAPEALKSRLEKIFVAKMNDFSPNAAALHGHGTYDGDLVFFNVGLSDACFQYAILYYEFICLISERIKKGEEHPRIKHLASAVNEHVIKLAMSQTRWNREKKVQLTQDDTLFARSDLEGYAVTVAVNADKFILYHEISHHLLGHTGGNLFSFIEKLPQECRCWDHAKIESYKHEFQADAGALLISLHGSAIGRDRAEVMELDIAIGSLLSLTVLGQFVGNIHAHGLRHPSIVSRFDQAIAILRSVAKDQEQLESVIDDFKRFQWLLFQTQRRGLGSRWDVKEFNVPDKYRYRD